MEKKAEDRTEERSTGLGSMEESGWKEVYSLGGRISMKIPTGWERPSEEWIEKRFPYSQKPQEIFTDTVPTGQGFTEQDSMGRIMEEKTEGGRILTCNLLEEQLQKKQIWDAVSDIQKNIDHVYPGSIRDRAKTIKTMAGVTGYFSFVTGGIRQESCHYMFLLPVGDSMVLGSYHFPAEWGQEEKKLFVDIIKSMKVIQEEGGGKKGYGRNIW